MSSDGRSTDQVKQQRRLMALASICGAVALVAIGIVLEIVMTKRTPGLICLIFGAVALALWVPLWPRYKRKGYI